MDSASLLRDLEERRERSEPSLAAISPERELALANYFKVKGDPLKEQEAVIALARLGMLGNGVVLG